MRPTAPAIGQARATRAWHLCDVVTAPTHRAASCRPADGRAATTAWGAC